MSKEYDIYLQNHKNAVREAFEWIKKNLPELVIPMEGVDYDWQIGVAHDASKSDPEEYDAYDRYFYGGNRSFAVVNEFNYAWLRHIHHNPHHWQYWVLLNDDSELGVDELNMPYNYILEMICDWFAFSFIKGDLREIFKWYDEHKDYIKLSLGTRETVESVLGKIDRKLSEMEE